MKRMTRMTQRTGRAIFLDRDGTLVHPRHYPSRPEDLRLYDGIGLELRALRRMGFRLVVITNQSGLARGLFTVADLDRMHAHLRKRLAAQGVWLDGVYYCPHHPDGVIPGLARRCDCRKPAPGMLLRAADELRLSLADSWLVGDILDDVEAGHRARCRSVLVDLGTESPPRMLRSTPSISARTIPMAWFRGWRDAATAASPSRGCSCARPKTCASRWRIPGWSATSSMTWRRATARAARASW